MVGLVGQRSSKVREGRVGVALDQGPPDGDGFVACGQRFFPPSQVRQEVGVVGQRSGKIRQGHAGAPLDQGPPDGDSFLDRSQRFFPPPQGRQTITESQYPSRALAVAVRLVNQTSQDIRSCLGQRDCRIWELGGNVLERLRRNRPNGQRSIY